MLEFSYSNLENVILALIENVIGICNLTGNASSVRMDLTSYIS